MSEAGGTNGWQQTRSVSPSTTLWRTAARTQTTISSVEDTTVRVVQEAFLELVAMSREGIESAREQDLAFLANVEQSLRSAGATYARAVGVVRDEAQRAHALLMQLENDRFQFLLAWEAQEQVLHQLRSARQKAVASTWELCGGASSTRKNNE